MTVQTRERLTYLGVSLLVLGGTVLYARQWDLLHQWDRYQQSNQDLETTRADLEKKSDEVKKARERADNMAKDPVEKEATVRRISKGVRGDEIVFRVEEETPPAQK